MKHSGFVSILVCLLASCLEESGGDPPGDVVELADEPTEETIDEPIALRGPDEAPAAATWCTSITLMSAGGSTCSTTTTLRKVADYVCRRDYKGYSASRVYDQNGCKPGYFGVVSYKCCR